MSIKEASLIIDKAFSKLVGMVAAKARLKAKLLAALKEDNFFSPTLIAGSAGLGKSRIMEILAGLAEAILGVNPLYFNDGEECGTRLAFVEKILIPQFHDQKAWIFTDEYPKANAKVQNLFRSLMNPAVERHPVTVRAAHDLEVTYHPNLNSFVFATNEVDKLDAPFLSRVDTIYLPLYTIPELELILNRALKDAHIVFNEGTSALMAACNRGTARDIVLWSDAIRGHVSVSGKHSINKADAYEIIRLRETYPHGVTQNELATLLHLERASGGLQLKELAERNCASAKEQNSNEKYLHRCRFIQIDGKRFLTQEGRDYLAELRKEKFIGKVAK